MEPRNRPSSVSRISAGSRQLFVGPASCSSSEQMKVRSSTRATSPGSDQGEVGVGPLGVGEPLEGPGVDEILAERGRTPPRSRRTRWMSSGWVSAATSSTQSSELLVLVGTVVVLTWRHAPRSPAGRASWRLQSPRADRASASSSTRTLPVGLVAGAPGVLPGHEHEALELRHQRAVLVEDPRVDLDRAPVGLGARLAFSSTSDSTNRVSPWKTGAGWLSSSVARLAIALPETSETLIPSASEYTRGPRRRCDPAGTCSRRRR